MIHSCWRIPFREWMCNLVFLFSPDAFDCFIFFRSSSSDVFGHFNEFLTETQHSLILQSVPWLRDGKKLIYNIHHHYRTLLYATWAKSLNIVRTSCFQFLMQDFMIVLWLLLCYSLLSISGKVISFGGIGISFSF